MIELLFKTVKVKCKTLYKIANFYNLEITHLLLEEYGPEPVGWGGEQLWELSITLPQREVKYLCYEHRY
jgi:hypothetical protein